jgi:hypothetical protein
VDKRAAKPNDKGKAILRDNPIIKRDIFMLCIKI